MSGRNEVTLSKGDIEALNNGETVKLDPNYGYERVTINPPCEEAGHDWRTPNVKRVEGGDAFRLRRSCSNCGTVEWTETSQGEFAWVEE